MQNFPDKETNPYYKINPKYFDELLELCKNAKGICSSLRYSKKHLADWIYEVTKEKLSKNNNSTRIFLDIDGNN